MCLLPINITLLFTCTLLSAQMVLQTGNLRVVCYKLVIQESKPLVLRGVSFGWHNW